MYHKKQQTIYFKVANTHNQILLFVLSEYFAFQILISTFIPFITDCINSNYIIFSTLLKSI
jgi:hypothetical protein